MNTNAGNGTSPIGVFDSGYGGLTILREFVRYLPSHDFIYLGDNARAPYGPRSFETVYAYTLEAVKALFAMGCPLVVLACNTSSAKALRTIQQKDLPQMDPVRRVLGVLRPTAEIVDRLTRTRHVGIVGTEGTVASESYLLEIGKLFPEIVVVQEACPMWVPLVENEEISGPGTDYFVEKHVNHLLSMDPGIDAIILGCTHYPLLMDTIMKYVPPHVTVVSQDRIVAESLADYLRRHPEMESRLTKNGTLRFLTTETAGVFERRAGIFFQKPVRAEKIVFKS